MELLVRRLFRSPVIQTCRYYAQLGRRITRKNVVPRETTEGASTATTEPSDGKRLSLREAAKVDPKKMQKLRDLRKHLANQQKASRERKIRVMKDIVGRAFDKMPNRFRLADLSFINASERIRYKKKKTLNKDETEPLPMSFTDLEITPPLIEALALMQITKPNATQTVTIPKIMKESQIMLAAETGSGKTLAYLLPMMTILKNYEIKTHKSRLRADKTIAYPSGVILVPTRELALQTAKIAKLLGQFVKLKTEVLLPGDSDTEQKKALFDDYDILITVPSIFTESIRTKAMNISRLQFLVVDEADSLFDSEFRQEMRDILLEHKLLDTLQKVVTVSATITRPVVRFIDEVFPKIRKVVTEAIHTPADQLRQRFVNIGPGYRARDKLCLNLVKSEPSSKIMIFCNRKISAEGLHQFFKQNNTPALCIHGDIKPRSRTRILKEFSEATSAVLICTDVVSRGIDIPNVNHVILHQFPLNSIDYLHRIGRTARNGRGGRVTAFLTKKDKSLARFAQKSIHSHKSFSELLSLYNSSSR